MFFTWKYVILRYSRIKNLNNLEILSNDTSSIDGVIVLELLIGSKSYYL